MKKYGVKGVVPMLVVALVLGLATSVFAAGNWSFGVKGGMGFMAPLIAGGDFGSESWNDTVDDINQLLEDAKDLIEDMGGTASINLAEKITRGWNVEGYGQYRITKTFGLRGSVGYLTGMKSTFGGELEDWDDLSGKATATISASCLFLSLEPVMTLPMGNFLLTFGAGPGYYMQKSSISANLELADSWDTLLDLTIDAPLSGSKIGYRGFLGGEYSTGSLTIGAELGYMSTGQIETTGEVTITGEVFGEPPVDETEEVTGKLDFSGLYILFGIGFAV